MVRFWVFTVVVFVSRDRFRGFVVVFRLIVGVGDAMSGVAVVFSGGGG